MHVITQDGILWRSLELIRLRGIAQPGRSRQFQTNLDQAGLPGTGRICIA